MEGLDSHSTPGHTLAPLPGGAAGQSPGATRRPPSPHPLAAEPSPAPELRVLCCPLGLPAVIRLQNLAPASQSVLGPKSPQGTTSKKQEDGPKGEDELGTPASAFCKLSSKFSVFRSNKSGPPLCARGCSAPECRKPVGRTPESNKARELKHAITQKIPFRTLLTRVLWKQGHAAPVLGRGPPS